MSDYSDVNDPVNVKLAALTAGSLGYYGSERTGGTALSSAKFGFEVRNEADTGMNAELGSLIWRQVQDLEVATGELR